MRFPGNQNRAHHRNRRNRVGQRHQRRMQERRHAANQFETQKRRKHENVNAEFEIHTLTDPPLALTMGAASIASRIFVFTTEPPCVTSVSRTISSSVSSASAPSPTSV